MHQFGAGIKWRPHQLALPLTTHPFPAVPQATQDRGEEAEGYAAPPANTHLCEC